MKCPNCGKENENGTKFCTACGYPLIDEELDEPEYEPPKKKRRFLWLIIVLLIAAVAGIGTFFIFTHFNDDEIEAAGETTSSASASETGEPAVVPTEETAAAIPSATAASESTLIPEAETDDDYFLPESNIREITDADLAGFSAKELTYARNEIYARHGKVFVSSELNAYFQTKSWYHADSSFVDTDLSPLETSNAVTILHYQQSHGLEYKPS